jgi:hypothetical protein
MDKEQLVDKQRDASFNVEEEGIQLTRFFGGAYVARGSGVRLANSLSLSLSPARSAGEDYTGDSRTIVKGKSTSAGALPPRGEVESLD